MRVFAYYIFFIVFSVSACSGCAISLYRHEPDRAEDIGKLYAGDQKERTYPKELKNVKQLLLRNLSTPLDRGYIFLDLLEEGLRITISADYLFDYGKSLISKRVERAIDSVAFAVRYKAPGRLILIESHTDNLPLKYSEWDSKEELSMARAVRIKQHFTSKGFDPELITAVGFAGDMPAAVTDAPAGRSRNRRVEIYVKPKAYEEEK
jgi:flagellar motor protein MotB